MIDDLVDNGFYTTCCTCTNHYSIRFTDSNTNSIDTSGEHYIYNIGIKGAADAADLVNRIDTIHQIISYGERTMEIHRAIIRDSLLTRQMLRN